MNDAVIEQDERLVITGWDEQAERLFGWTPAEAIGQPSRILVPIRNRPKSDRALSVLLASKPSGPTTQLLTAVHKSGREFKIETSIALTQDGGATRIVAHVRSTRDLVEMRLLATEQTFHALVDRLEDGFFEVDLNGVFLQVNDAYCRMIGRARDELLGTSFKNLFTDEEEVRVTRDAYTRVYATGEPLKGFEHTVATKDGTVRIVEDTVTLKRDSQGSSVGFLGIRRDCTDRKRAGEQLAAAKEAAEAANLAKSEFLANMSHEIRTPMNGIIGMTDLALDTQLTAFQTECLTTVRSSAETLLTILNDILDFSKIESRKLELESVPFPLHDLVGDTVKPLALRACQKGLELITDVPSDLPEALMGDPTRLRQVLTNLLGNAIKFTERGQVMLAVREVPSADERVALSFSVSDTGIGIPSDKHATVFEAFSQADGSTTRRFGGTGLGLAISSTLVSLMGSSITVRSTPGLGSTFEFTIAFSGAQSKPAIRTGRLTHLRALVVDDNAVNRGILETQLRRWGITTVAVDGGQAAIDALAGSGSAPFEIVLVDAQMPDVDGFDVAAHIARRPELTGTTIMMLSSGGRYGDSDRCRSLGVSGFLTKPVKPSDLFDAICRALDGAASRPAMRVAAPMAAPEAIRRLKILLAEDNIVNQRVAVGLLARRGHEVTVASTGREALEALALDRFDVVLMDVQMPEMGGFEATAAIRAGEAGTGRRQRIIAMTAHAMTGDRERCLAAGMDGYISKPVEPAVLFTAVEDVEDIDSSGSRSHESTNV